MPKPSEIYIVDLAQTFPTLNRLQLRAENWDCDYDHLVDLLGILSSGERHAVLFILCVWNPLAAKKNGWSFDAIEAMSTWDSEHRRAFAAWCQNPNWP